MEGRPCGGGCRRAEGTIALEGDKCRSMRGGETLHFLMRVPQLASLPEPVIPRSAKAIWPPWFLSGSCNDAGSFKAPSGPAFCWCSSGGGCLHRGPESEEGSMNQAGFGRSPSVSVAAPQHSG